MGQNDVYGIGNALVDIEVEVQEEFLKQFSIEKGVMTLIDEERQDFLLEKLLGKKWKKTGGGSAANTMMGIAQLDGKGFYSCKVAKDEYGDFFYEDLKKGGLHSNDNQEREEGITGKCLVLITPDADRTLNTFLGITQTFSEQELVEEELKNSKYLYIEGYLLCSPLGNAAALKAKKMAKKHGVKVSLTLSDPFIVQNFRQNIVNLIGDGIDLIFCNEDEALAFAETKSLAHAKDVLKKSCKEFAITLGSQGSLVFDGKEEHQIKACKTNAVNTNGAGDAYAGAFLYGITNGLDFEKSGALASKISASVVSQFGPRLSKEETQKIKKELLR